METEKLITAKSGFLGIFLLIGILGLPWYFFSIEHKVAFWIVYVLLIILACILMNGFSIVNPNQSIVFTLFGKYAGTIKENGFFFTNPFYAKKVISLRARNFDSERLKVNDLLGNPILISTILVWKVKDTYKAAFDVDNYENFVKVQIDAAVRKLAGSYPYDNFEDHENELTLRSGVAEINISLEKELDERLSMAGIEVMEARIGYLAYAEEIAQAMLKRQQATAIVSARLKIVEGAVGMVEKALEMLSEKNIIELDQERKAAMVSNLLVVLCSDKDTNPVINAGTLNH